MVGLSISRDKKTTSEQVVFLLFATGIKLIQIYYLCLAGQVELGLKNGSIRRDMVKASNRKSCVIVGRDIWKNLTGAEGKHYFFKRKYTDKNGIDAWKGDEFFSGKKELAEFFGIEEDLKELDGVKLGQVFIRFFGTKKALTDQGEKLWVSKSEGHLGNQVKITKASPERHF